MECRQCGKILSEQEKFCTYCGYYNDPNELDENLTQVELNSKTVEILNEHNKNLKEEFEDKSKFKIKCLKTFLANDYDNVITGGFNIYALIFSWIYFIYKKMYLIGITGLIIAGVLLLYEKIFLIIYALISMVISGLFFNKIYKWKADKVITKLLKNNNNNPSKILKKVKKAGKENILMTLFIYFIFLLLLIFMYLKVEKDFGFDKYWRENSNNKATCLSMIQTAKLQSNNNLTATLTEAGCIVVDAKNEQFEIYLNFETTNQTVIEKYNIENSKMYFIGNTELLTEYENSINRLNDFEINHYQSMLEIKYTYTKIIQNSNQEERLIKTKSNITPRKYFILKKEEINR